MKVGTTAEAASFGPYEIVASLGQGGVGEVFRAWDPRLEREVALKILRDRSGRDPERLQRFVAEARAASALNHPNILTVFDAAVDGDTPFIVSELIEGVTLREEIRRGPVALRRLLDLAYADCRRSVGGARGGDRPSRSQARKHHGHAVRASQDPGLRPDVVRGRTIRRR